MQLADGPAFTSPVWEYLIDRLILYVKTLVREVLNNGRALLVVGDAFELHSFVHVLGNSLHELDGEGKVRTS